MLAAKHICSSTSKTFEQPPCGHSHVTGTASSSSSSDALFAALTSSSYSSSLSGTCDGRAGHAVSALLPRTGRQVDGAAESRHARARLAPGTWHAGTQNVARFARHAARGAQQTARVACAPGGTRAP